jgi:hypothetical protein
MNQVDNELEQELIVTFVRDQKSRSIIKTVFINTNKKKFISTSSGINDRQIPSRTPKPVINVNI